MKLLNLNIFFLLSFFILTPLEAQIFSQVKKIIPLSGVPSNISPSSKPFLVSFKALGAKGEGLRGKKIKIIKTKGISTLSEVSTKSDNNGVVSFIFTPGAYPEEVEVRVSYSPITKKVTDALNIDDESEVFYIQTISIADQTPDYTKSSASLFGQKTFLQTKENIKARVEIKNKYDNLIDDKKFNFKFILDNKEVSSLSSTKVSTGVYEFSFEPPLKSGKYSVVMKLEGEESLDEIEVLPLVDFRKVKTSLEKISKKDYSYTVSLFDQNNDPFISKEKLPSTLLAENKEIKIKKIDDLKFSIEVPKGEGESYLNFSLSDKYKTKDKIKWINFPYENKDIRVEVSPKEILATGYDKSFIKLSLDHLSFKEQKAIFESDSFSVNVAEGKGRVGAFKLMGNDKTGYYLEANFYAPTEKGESRLEIFNNKGSIDDSQKISYDVLITRCEVRPNPEFATFHNIYDNVNLFERVVDGLLKTEGFTLTNDGPNDIVPKGWERSFRFSYPDQAKQNMKLSVEHIQPEGAISATHMLSSFYFFPRTTVPRIIDESGDTYTVIIPTGEEVVFDKKTNKIISGVLEEGPVDGRADRFSRTFPDIRYKGTGYVLRANARGQLPEEGNFNKTKIAGEFGHIGGEGVLIYKYDEKTKTTKKCNVTKKQVFLPNAIFKFSTDEEFYEFVEKNCKFK